MGRRRPWNLLTSDSVAILAPSAQYAAYATAYLDSADRLCRVLARSTRKATFERASVIMFLAAHAVELFLKGAIVRQSPSEKFGHNLEHLHNRYKSLFPGKRFELCIPFETSYGKLSAKEIAALKRSEPHESERFRYPGNERSFPWNGLYGFEPTSFLNDLSALREDFDRLLRAYDA